MRSRIIGAVAALTIAGLGGLTIAAPAQATQDGPITVGSGDCTTVEFGWTADAKAGTTLVVAVGGEVQTAPVGTPIVLDPPAEPTTVLWRVFGGPERDWDLPLWTGYVGGGEAGKAWKASITKWAADHGGWGWTLAGPDDGNPFVVWGEVEVKGCVTPEAPTLTPAACDSLAELTVPKVEGVVYSHTSGPLNPGVHVVAASPDGYGWAFPPGAETEWEFEVQAVPGCPGADGKDGEPGADGSDGQAFVPAGQQLPVTGSEVGILAALGLAAVGAGLGLLRAGRRRRTTS